MLALAALALVPAADAWAQEPGPDGGPGGPNVVVLMTDDQTVRDMAPLRRTRRLIGRAGVTFTRSFVSYPVCCPSRATFLTGQYAHNNDVLCLYPWCGGGYGRLRQREYLPVWLERAGYVTAHMGKFLNGYGLERPPDIPRGWTEWYGLVDHTTYRMWGYTMYENGRRRTYGRVLREQPRLYQTDVLRRKAVTSSAGARPTPHRSSCRSHSSHRTTSRVTRSNSPASSCARHRATAGASGALACAGRPTTTSRTYRTSLGSSGAGTARSPHGATRRS